MAVDPAGRFPHFRLAEDRDEKALREILEQGDFKGRISLLYTRRPRVLESLKREGKTVEVYFCPEGGFGAAAVNPMMVEDEEEPVTYLFSFRMDRNRHKALRYIPEGYSFYFHRMQELGVRRAFTTILEDNRPAVEMLEKKRRSMPRYDFLGRIETVALKTGGRGRLPKGWTFESLKKDAIPEMLSFYRQEIRRFSYAPVMTVEDLLKGEQCPQFSSFRILRNPEGSIVAMGAIWDQRDYKQYRVMGYSGIFRLLRPVSRWLFPLLGYPPLPPADSVLKMFCLGFCLVRDNDPRVFRTFLGIIRASARDYDSLSLGMFQSHRLLKELKRGPHISYKSRFYRVYPPGEESPPPEKIPFIEIGRL